jgi:predicted transcriptional regulator
MHHKRRVAHERGGDGSDDLITAVTKRAEFLSAFSSEPIPKRDLGDELRVSRSTVYKAVRELREHDLVKRTDDGLELTLAGRLLETEYDTFRGTWKTCAEPANCSLFSRPTASYR